MNREEWLNQAAARIKLHFQWVFDLHFAEHGEEQLANLLVSTGFPSKGGLTKVIGECWRSEASEKGGHHIFINPRLVDPVEIIAVLAHEMVHAADNGEHHHKGVFVRAVRDMGLEGKATATVAGEEFKAWATKVVAEIGTYSHEGLTPVSVTKTQTTRMIKLEAACCGYVVRTTKKWIETGYPSCPCGNEMEEA